MPVALFEHLLAALVALLRILMANRPVGLLGVRHSKHGLEHILLAEIERVDVNTAVLPIVQTRAGAAHR